MYSPVQKHCAVCSTGCDKFCPISSENDDNKNQLCTLSKINRCSTFETHRFILQIFRAATNKTQTKYLLPKIRFIRYRKSTDAVDFRKSWMYVYSSQVFQVAIDKIQIKNQWIPKFRFICYRFYRKSTDALDFRKPRMYRRFATAILSYAIVKRMLLSENET